MNIYDIAFYIVIGVGVLALVWECIPDGLKSFWKYQRDSKRNPRDKYSFNFRGWK